MGQGVGGRRCGGVVGSWWWGQPVAGRVGVTVAGGGSRHVEAAKPGDRRALRRGGGVAVVESVEGRTRRAWWVTHRARPSESV